MDTRTRRILDLEERNTIHSAKLKTLQQEIDHVQAENDMLFNYVKTKDTSHGFQPHDAAADTERRFVNSRASYDKRENDNAERFGEFVPLQDDRRSVNSRASYDKHKNDKVERFGEFVPLQDERMSVNSRASYDKRENGKDERFGGFIPISPNRSRHVTPDLRPKEKASRNIISPREKEHGLGDDKLNSREKSTDFDYEEYQRQRRAQIYSYYDQTAINPHLWEKKPKHSKYPWYDHKTHPYPGGFLILRFDDAGCDVCTIAIKAQQSICRHAGGYLMGISRKERIFVFENAPCKQKNWTVSRHQPYKDCLKTEDALALFWFTREDAAVGFFENTHKNRFRESCFPTPNGFEAVYVPLLTPPTRPLNTFLCVELLDARKYSPEDLTQFEGEVRNDMSRVYPSCQPMVVSSQAGRVVFKPGMLLSQHSKFYISRFESQREVDQIWNLGMIQALRQKWRLTGPINVYSFSVDIAV